MLNMEFIFLVNGKNPSYNLRYLTYGHQRKKNCLRRCAINKGSDHPAHPRSPVSAFIIPLLESIISMLATSEISILYKLVTVAVETDFSLALWETPKTGFLMVRPI